MLMLIRVSSLYFLIMPDDFFKVITYNIYKGFNNEKENGLPAGEVRKQLIAKWLQEGQPDLVAFQELNGYTYQKLEQESRAWGHTHSSVLYGTSDFRLGISSRFPLEVNSQIFHDMWHGLLHVVCKNISVIVTHFSPFEYQLRQQEAHIVLLEVSKAREAGREILLMGDLNALSPEDDEAILQTDIIDSYRQRDLKKSHIQNLRDGRPDYSVIRKLTDAGLVDLHVQQRGQLPELPMPRLDYIWASQKLAAYCVNARWHTSEAFADLSDHYPVSAAFSADFFR